MHSRLIYYIACDVHWGWFEPSKDTGVGSCIYGHKYISLGSRQSMYGHKYKNRLGNSSYAQTIPSVHQRIWND